MTTKETTKAQTQTRDQRKNHTKQEINHEPNWRTCSEPRWLTQVTKPTNLGNEPTNRGSKPTNKAAKPTNPSSNWTHEHVWFLRRRSFSLYALFVICAEQELESLILEFHWKSFPTDLSSTGNRLLHTRVATVDSSILNSRCYFYK